MRTDEALCRLRDRLDRLWLLAAPTDDVDDVQLGYRQALRDMHDALTRNEWSPPR